QLEKLAKQGRFISQEELLRFKNKAFDKNYILITFDDGLKEQFQLAKPILDEIGIPFLCFINTSNFQETTVSLVHKIHLLRSRIAAEALLESLSKTFYTDLGHKERKLAIAHYNYDDEQTAVLKYLLNFKLDNTEQRNFIEQEFLRYFDEKKVVSDLYMEEDMLNELSFVNSLGSHSHHHLPLAKLPVWQIEEELVATQKFFKQEFKKNAQALSYPYGSYESCVGLSGLLKKHGFELAFTMERGVNKEIFPGEMLLSRFDCNDLPGGKANLFQTKPIFGNPTLRTWHQ
ncbi:MAG TPA: polysaccharide deacetylase family protein, partial [Salinimicrobium sp.]|nr:polysaccharide deacetylase family protein [Salinimicrobium sp.]